MTDKQYLIREIHEYVTTHGGENTATHLLVQAASAIQTQAAELEAVGAGGVQALRPEGGPPGSGGWQHHAEAMERERDHWRERARTMEEHQRGTVWYWQGDGNDHPESMVNSLPVVIRADQLRALSAAPAVTSEQRRLIGVIADKIGDGTLFQSGIYPKKDLARFVRNMLDATPTAPAASPTPPAEQQADPKAAPGKRLTREQIREVFMAHGFTIKEGQTDLKQYVYDAAHALLKLVAAPQQEGPRWKLSHDQTSRVVDVIVERSISLTQDATGINVVYDPDILAGALVEAIGNLQHAPQQEAIGLVESAVTGAGGFHVRLAPGAQMPAPGTKLYTAPQQEAQEPAFWMNEKGHTWSHSDWKQFPKHRAKYPIPLYPHFPAPQPAPAPLSDVSALIAEARENKIRARAFEADADRWRLVETASSDVTLRLHNLRPDQRAQYIDAALAAQGGKV